MSSNNNSFMNIKNRLIKNKNKNISIFETAEILEVSTGTIRNWIKLKFLNSINNKKNLILDYDEIIEFKSKIKNSKIDKLNRRANKKNAQSVFIPIEYIEDRNELEFYERILDYIMLNKLNRYFALFVLTLNHLYKRNIIKSNILSDILNFDLKNLCPKKNILNEIKDWFLVENFKNIDTTSYQQLLNFELPNKGDILGVLHQSLKVESDKSKQGSYYTPSDIVKDIVKNYCKKDYKVLDPCCGTGQFLMKFSNIVSKPENIFGFDIDKTAVRIARINLMLKYIDSEFKPNIFCKNAIFDLIENSSVDNFISFFNNFDLIATNPPWGYKFSKSDFLSLNKVFPELKSGDSFSYIIVKCIKLLKDNGILSVVLPESILNVKAHKDIRKYLLCNTSLRKIIYFNRVFKSVFSPVVRIDIEKNRNINEPANEIFTIKTNPNNSNNKSKNETNNRQFNNKVITRNNINVNEITNENSNSDNNLIGYDSNLNNRIYHKIIIKNNGSEYFVNQKRFISNLDYIFDIHLNDVDEKIINKVYSLNHTTLKKQASWALGIVTGDNNRFLQKKILQGFECIYKGKEISKYKLSSCENYIQFLPQRFQQVAPEEKYRAKEKLIYRFISDKLIFAYDNKKKLTLNSANIVIPKIKNYSIKVVLALFNSPIYQFIFKKKFMTIKVLRSHLEELPLPFFDKNSSNKIVSFVDNILNNYNENNIQKLNAFIFNLFKLTNNEINYLNDCIYVKNKKV